MASQTCRHGGGDIRFPQLYSVWVSSWRLGRSTQPRPRRATTWDTVSRGASPPSLGVRAGARHLGYTTEMGLMLT